MGQDQFLARSALIRIREPSSPRFAAMKIAIARGRILKVSAKAVRDQTVMLTQSGHRKLVSTNNAVGTTIWPTTIIVSQAGPSPALIPQKRSPHKEHLDLMQIAPKQFSAATRRASSEYRWNDCRPGAQRAHLDQPRWDQTYADIATAMTSAWTTLLNFAKLS
jgi:hypothetical protein